MSEYSYDKVTPVTAHDGMAANLYHEVFGQVGSVLNVAAGDTRLHDSLQLYGVATDIVSVDPAYARPEYSGREGYVAGLAQELPFADESFDSAMCQFGLQHIPMEDIPATIHEMIRITRTADENRDQTKGYILLNPVFKNVRLEKALAGFNDDVAFLWHHDGAGMTGLERRALYPTLVIHKTPDLTPETEQDLVNRIVASRSLKPTHRSIGEVVSRRLFGGSSRA